MLMLNQPFNGQLGDLLISKMQQQYNRLTIFSAFAKNSGVLRLKPAMEQFKASGGCIEAFIGVDAHGTSYEAVLNLFELCDALYIVHSENNATTFHSKVYMLSNDNGEKWMSVGSNNLTGGGLWTNFESATCFDVDVTFENCATEFEQLIDRYKDSNYTCSMLINSKEDLDNLLAEDYLRREITIQLEARAEHQHRTADERQRTPRRFGNQTGIHMPRLNRTPTGNVVRQRRGQAQTEVQAIIPIVETNASERMWFETRALTGGSRNILDLSKLGRKVLGDASGTRYETDNTNYILGDLVFFDINPEDTDVEKSVTVNYNGVDYTDCVIKYPAGDLANGTWRIQLKGHSTSGEKLHSIGGTGWLCNKILVFEKIRTDYYVMSVLEEDQLDTLKRQSRVVATNGSAANSKKYGLLQ